MAATAPGLASASLDVRPCARAAVQVGMVVRARTRTLRALWGVGSVGEAVSLP